MKSLRVIQLRNSPFQDGSITFPILMHASKAYADDFLDFGLGNPNELDGARRHSRLQAIIVGNQSFRQHWRLQHQSRENQLAPHFRSDAVMDRPMIFGVSFSEGIFGGRIPALQQVEFETVRDLHNFVPAEFMNSVWLQNSYFQNGN